MTQTKRKAKEKFHLFLSNKGLKPTLQRNLILDAFLGLERPTHIDELYLVLRGRHPHIGHATVYRTLRLFAAAGIAREFSRGDGLTRYEAAGQGTRRDYLVCNVCGSVTEFENGAVERSQFEAARKLGFAVASLKIELRGLCNHCQTD